MCTYQYIQHITITHITVRSINDIQWYQSNGTIECSHVSFLLAHESFNSLMMNLCLSHFDANLLDMILILISVIQIFHDISHFFLFFGLIFRYFSCFMRQNSPLIQAWPPTPGDASSPRSAQVASWRLWRRPSAKRSARRSRSRSTRSRRWTGAACGSSRHGRAARPWGVPWLRVGSNQC